MVVRLRVKVTVTVVRLRVTNARTHRGCDELEKHVHGDAQQQDHGRKEHEVVDSARRGQAHHEIHHATHHQAFEDREGQLHKRVTDDVRCRWVEALGLGLRVEG